MMIFFHQQVQNFLELVRLAEYDEMTDDEVLLVREMATGHLVNYCEEWRQTRQEIEQKKVD